MEVVLMDKKHPANGPDELRQRATHQALHESPVLDLETLTPEETRRLVHELKVHQIELEMQNEELRRSQMELDAARAGYFDLYDLAPVGYVTLDEKGMILESNLTAATLLGVPRASLKRQPLSRFIISDDQDAYFRFRKTITGADPQAVEVRLRRPDAFPRWTRLEATLGHEDETQEAVCRLVLSDVDQRRKDEERIGVALEEKKVLLREIHHRVKNNLQVIISLLGLQAGALKGEEGIKALMDSQERVYSMSLVHDLLYSTDDFSSIRLDTYISRLLDALRGSFFNYSEKISVKIEMPPLSIGMDQASAIGLVLNELLTNAFKHAFPGNRLGEIAITAHPVPDHNLRIVIKDNGVGLPPDLDWQKAETLGLALIHTLIEQQLRGTLEIHREEGTGVIMVIPDHEVQAPRTKHRR
jgi:PAS domain S-box-containing protein